MDFLNEFRAAAGIVALCVISAVIYGIAHDQVTARICVEYFTIGHPPIFNTDSPTLLGIGWGIIATWWAGAILGFPLAIAARFGKRPKFSSRDLIRPIAVLLGVMAVCAVFAGFAGNALAQTGTVQLEGSLAGRVPVDRHVAFLTDGFAHLTSYFVGFTGGILVVVNTWWRRRMLAGHLSANVAVS